MKNTQYSCEIYAETIENRPFPHYFFAKNGENCAHFTRKMLRDKLVRDYLRKIPTAKSAENVLKTFNWILDKRKIPQCGGRNQFFACLREHLRGAVEQRSMIFEPFRAEDVEEFPLFDIYLAKRTSAFNPEWAEDMPENLRDLPFLVDDENKELDDWLEYMNYCLGGMAFPLFVREYSDGRIRIDFCPTEEEDKFEFVGYVFSQVGNDEAIGAFAALSDAWTLGLRKKDEIQRFWE